MNKTISINIGGLFFQIDEEAYKLLENYLDSLKKHFENTEGREEILQDIESRIAEIFQGKIEKGQPLILPADVEEAIRILGKPDDIGSNETNNEEKKEKGSFFKKRLYRDEDNRVLGGVCSGLGHYFNVDPVWFRIFFVAAMFIFGTSVLIYILLWIIIPRASTTEEKLNMRGEPMTISEIQENIKNEFEELKSRFREMKGDARNHSRREFHEMKRKMRRAKREASYSQRNVASAVSYSKSSETGFGSVLGEIIYYFVRALLVFTGFILLLFAIVLIGSLVLSMTASDGFLFFTKWGITSISFPAFFGLFFENLWQQQLVTITLILLIGVPLVMLVFNSIRMIAGIKTKNRIISVTASLLWLVGLVLAIFLTINIIGNFSEKSSVRQEILLPQTNKALTVDINDNLPGLRNKYYSDDANIESDEHDHQRFVFKNCYFSDYDGKFIAYGLPKLKIIPSKSDEYKLSVMKFSRGKTIMGARNRAEAIKMTVVITDSVLYIDNYFLLPVNEKWRNQSVRIVLEVPEGKSIFMTKNLENLIYDRDNIDSTWDLNMLGKTMFMVNGRLTSDVVVVTDTVKNTK